MVSNNEQSIHLSPFLMIALGQMVLIANIWHKVKASINVFSKKNWSQQSSYGWLAVASWNAFLNCIILWLHAVELGNIVIYSCNEPARLTVSSVTPSLACKFPCQSPGSCPSLQMPSNLHSLIHTCLCASPSKIFILRERKEPCITWL